MRNPYPCVRSVSISELKFQDDDRRSLSKEEIVNLRKRVATFGTLRLPTVNARTMSVIDGRELLRIRASEGVIETQVWMVDLSQEDEVTARLALNGSCGEWNWKRVSVVLKAMRESGVDLTLTGFREDDIGPLVEADWSKSDVEDKQGSLL